MEYVFKIETSVGVVTSTVQSSVEFDCAPFGYVGYREPCSCECDSSTLETFWSCIDHVLEHHNLSSDDFVRAINASRDGKLIGEM